MRFQKKKEEEEEKRKCFTGTKKRTVVGRGTGRSSLPVVTERLVAVNCAVDWGEQEAEAKR